MQDPPKKTQSTHMDMKRLNDITRAATLQILEAYLVKKKERAEGNGPGVFFFSYAAFHHKSRF